MRKTVQVEIPTPNNGYFAHGGEFATEKRELVCVPRRVRLGTGLAWECRYCGKQSVLKSVLDYCVKRKF